MVQFTTIFSTLAKNISIRSGRKSRIDVGREAADTLAKEARKNEMMLTTSGIVNANRTNNMASAYSKRGKKGINQDRFIVWEEFGCQDDMIYCGNFDGHGPWDHVVAKTLRQLMPTYLLCNWQETLAQHLLKPDVDVTESSEGCHCQVISLLLQILVILGLCWQQIVMLEESQRITQSNGRIFSPQDEPGVPGIWMPNANTLEGPGLAISRAFGDYYIKDFGPISDPELTQRRITGKDQFVILATDGVFTRLTFFFLRITQSGRRKSSAFTLIMDIFYPADAKRFGT